MKKTALYEEHVKLNANIIPFAGWMLPVQYSSIKEEVHAVRNSCGVFDVSHMGEFFVEGKDALAFVDYLVCNDIKAAPVGKAIYSPLLNNNATCIDDLIVYILNPEKILICVNASNIEKDWNWIKTIHSQQKWDTVITNASEKFSLLALQGPQSESLISQVLNFDYQTLPYYGVTSTLFKNTETIIARTGYTGEDGFEIFISNDLVRTLWQDFLRIGAKPCGLGARDCLRIEVCYPLYGHELNEELTPFDVGLKWAVKLKKNDFIGKNSLIHYNAKWKQIKFFASKGIPREGYVLKSSDGEVIGKVTSGTLSPTINRGIGLGLIRSDVNLDSGLLMEMRNQLFPIEVTKESFVKGGHK